MNSADGLTDKEFERLAFAILERELGPEGLARFFRTYLAESGDYTRDRHRWLDSTTIEEIMADVESRNSPAT